MNERLVAGLLLSLGLCSLQAAEFHVAKNGQDANIGSAKYPLLTIQAAADKAQPGDTITVHAGVYRERVNPPRGGISDTQRITYRAAEGDEVVIKGSEVVTGWAQAGKELWQVVLPNSFFGNFNPFGDPINGHWFRGKGRKHHSGAVYLNGHWLAEAESKEELFGAAKVRRGEEKEYLFNVAWMRAVGDAAKQFPAAAMLDQKGVKTAPCAEGGECIGFIKEGDPNRELTEVNARQTVFYPEKPSMHYITLDGFTLEHAATPWAPPTTEQIGLVGTHWSKGWIIENNTIRYSVCTGVTLGKYSDPDHLLSGPSAGGYNETIERAVTYGWTKETVGGHLVRNNHISHCEQAGIVGSLGAIFSTVTGNVIHDINQRGAFGGAEIAGIKFHAAIDSVISRNHIYRCRGTGSGIWLDWMAQGARVSGNLLHNNSIDLFLEVNHGPLLVDNNMFLSANFLRDWSQGTAFAHNLIRGKMAVRPQGRTTPVHKPHATEIVELRDIDCGDNRFFNNVFLSGADTKPYQQFSESTVMQGNVFPPSKAHLVAEADGTFLGVDLDERPAGDHPLVTSDLLGLAQVPNQRFEQPNGAPYRLDTDYFGNPRNADRPGAGPFSAPQTKNTPLKVWPIGANL